MRLYDINTLCYRYRHHIMYLLVFLEMFLGAISTWPRDVLMAIFVEPPTTPKIMRVSAFFYGNGVPLCIASTFFGLCNPYGNFAILNDMHSVYHMWFQGRNARHQAPYYDIRFKKMYWINGEESPVREPLLPEVTDVPLGFQGSGFDELIVEKLNSISREECVFTLL